jgi:hypothetical protein
MRLVERDRGLPIDDLRWLQDQGIRNYGEVTNPAIWYEADGTFSKGPTDPYHLHLYRGKGWTLRAPNVPPPVPPKPALPWYAARAIRVLGSADEWVGTVSEFIEVSGVLGTSPDQVGRRLFQAKVYEALAQEGISLTRERSVQGRMLKLMRQ